VPLALIPTSPGGPGTFNSPGSGKVKVVGAPRKLSTTLVEPEPKSTSPVSDTSIGVVAGGSGGDLTTRQAALVSWVPAVTVAVIAPESVSEPWGVTDPPGAPRLAAGAVPDPQLVEVTKSASRGSVPSAAIERITWSEYRRFERDDGPTESGAIAAVSCVGSSEGIRFVHASVHECTLSAGSPPNEPSGGLSPNHTVAFRGRKVIENVYRGVVA
jgi:hypothetical protein